MFFHINKKERNATASNAGGKGYSLIKMCQDGIPIPRGLVISTDVYDNFIQDKIISDNLHLLENKKIQEKALNTIVDRITCIKFEDTFILSFKKEMRKNNAKFFSVRSSANVEDSSSQSFAGEFESFLFVNKEDILDRVKKCYISAFSNRIMHYLKKPSDMLDIKMAVVVQEMIPSDTSGVCFTANPLDSKEDDIVIEAVHGLGEYLAQGAVIPDKYIIQRSSHIPLEVDFSVQVKMLVAKRGGGIKEVSDSHRNEQKLSGDEMVKIAQIAEKIEKKQGCPSDIEWAYANKDLYILQSRPIIFTK